jgi:hypothetical protein
MVALLVCIVILGCGSSQELQTESESIAVTKSLATKQNQDLSVALNWVIVRNGPGSWVTNADWDEYILRITNSTGSSIRITAVQVTDALGAVLDTSSQHRQLIRQSKKTIKRYKGHDLEVKAGAGADALMVAGSAVYLASAATGYAVLTGSVAASSAATAAAVGGALVVAPVLILASISEGHSDAKVAAALSERHSELPLRLSAAETRDANFFFSIAPSPQQISLHYTQAGLDKILVIDLTETLAGLHLVGNDRTNP